MLLAGGTPQAGQDRHRLPGPVRGASHQQRRRGARSPAGHRVAWPVTARFIHAGPAGTFASTGTATATVVGTTQSRLGGWRRRSPPTPPPAATPWSPRLTFEHPGFLAHQHHHRRARTPSRPPLAHRSQRRWIGVPRARCQPSRTDGGGDPVWSAPQVSFAASARSTAPAPAFATGEATAMAVTDSAGVATAGALTADDTAGAARQRQATASGTSPEAPPSTSPTWRPPHAMRRRRGRHPVGSGRHGVPHPSRRDRHRRWRNNPVSGRASSPSRRQPCGLRAARSSGTGTTATRHDRRRRDRHRPGASLAGATPGGYVVTASVGGARPPGVVSRFGQPAGRPGCRRRPPLSAWRPPPTADSATGPWRPTAASSSIGDACSLRSDGRFHLAAPVVGMAVDP